MASYSGLSNFLNARRSNKDADKLAQYKLDKAAYDKQTSLQDMARVNEGLAPFFDKAVEGMDPATANYMRLQQQLMADPLTNKTGQSSLADMMKQRTGYRTGMSKLDYEIENPKPTAEMLNIKNWGKLTPGEKENAIERAKAMKSSITINEGNEWAPLSETKQLMTPSGKSVPAYIKKAELRALNPVLKNEYSEGKAGKLAGLILAQELIPELDKAIYDVAPEGLDGTPGRTTMNRDVINSAFLISNDFTPGEILSRGGMKFFGVDELTQERAASMANSLETGIQAMTRTETGAAMADKEIDNMKKRFTPTTFDSDRQVFIKMQSYKNFLKNAIDFMAPTYGDDVEKLKSDLDRAYEKSNREARDAYDDLEGRNPFGQEPKSRENINIDSDFTAKNIMNKTKSAFQDFGGSLGNSISNMADSIPGSNNAAPEEFIPKIGGPVPGMPGAKFVTVD